MTFWQFFRACVLPAAGLSFRVTSQVVFLLAVWQCQDELAFWRLLSLAFALTAMAQYLDPRDFRGNRLAKQDVAESQPPLVRV